LVVVVVVVVVVTTFFMATTTCKEEAEDQQTESDASAEEPHIAEVIRAPKGSFVIWSCEHATLSHNPTNGICKRLRPRWLQATELGTHEASKTLPVASFDHDSSVSYVVLQAWLLHRLRYNNFLNRKESRKLFWLDQLHTLKKTVR
jgi:hypothetical protein